MGFHIKFTNNIKFSYGTAAFFSFYCLNYSQVSIKYCLFFSCTVYRIIIKVKIL